jgi:hypothetical protein
MYRARQVSQQQPQRPGPAPARVGSSQCGSSQNTRSAPASSAASAHSLVEAGGRQPPPVVERLARVRPLEHEPALGLAAERPPHTPRPDLHLEAAVARRRHDQPHRLAVVGEVVLGERVQDAAEAPPEHVVEIALDVAQDARAEVRAARDHWS